MRRNHVVAMTEPNDRGKVGVNYSKVGCGQIGQVHSAEDCSQNPIAVDSARLIQHEEPPTAKCVRRELRRQMAANCWSLLS